MSESQVNPEAKKSAKQPEVTPEELKALAGKYPIELLSEETLADASVKDCEMLLTTLRGMNQTLIAKAHMVHCIMEKKEQLEIEDAKLHGKSDDQIALLEQAIARRKAKPATQHLAGSHITRDEKVGSGGAAPVQ